MNPVTEPVKITSLELENVKRIRACAITPTQNGLTVIGGRNNQGKTSVLDAIDQLSGGVPTFLSGGGGPAPSVL